MKLKNWLIFLFCLGIIPQCATRKEKSFLPPQSLILIELPIKLLEGNTCPVCQKKLVPCQIERGARKEFEEALEKTVEQYRIQLLAINPSGKENDLGSQLRAGREWAERVGADWILLPVIFCWQERKGTSFSALKPARVGFHLHFFSARGEESWQGEFLEEQVPLSENLLEIDKFFKRGGKWLTAGELAEEGLEKIFKEFFSWREEDAGNPGN